MPSISRIRSLSYLASHATRIAEELVMNVTPFFITRDGKACMVIENVKQFREKESLIAALKIMALGEKDRMQGKDISAAESRAQLAAARQRRK
ncbi:type II toxin-antitoxin system Phd/YefM family antitoxin [Variovorax sp. 22077]|uniref:type II toxin-antitoxin system Phd/YefM family antitoxin n=1 Tax=Variovorax sp. 22077 TaxID=3453867 RepID=UPI003F855E4F